MGLDNHMAGKIIPCIKKGLINVGCSWVPQLNVSAGD